MSLLLFISLKNLQEMFDKLMNNLDESVVVLATYIEST